MPLKILLLVKQLKIDVKEVHSNKTKKNKVMVLMKDSNLMQTKSVRGVAPVGHKPQNLWWSTSLPNITSCSKLKRNSSDLSSRNPGDLMKDDLKSTSSSVSTLSAMPQKNNNMLDGVNRNSIVTIVLVEVKGLPPVVDDGARHNIFCKFSLGAGSYKTKAVANTVRPEWGERFTMRLTKDDSLKISVWDKGKHKNFMGSCILDLSLFEKERTHEIWKKLDDGYGLIHLSVTICLSSSNTLFNHSLLELKDVEPSKYILCNLTSNCQLVGSLYINIFGARGLIGKSNVYCVLELDNERVQTPKEGASSEITWNKCYLFNVYDVTSTLVLKVYGRSLSSGLFYELIGKVSIPLLMIVNGETRWYALKDKNKKCIAKGNCPRVCLQMKLIWNPVKASLRLFRPKPVRYVKKSKKFDVVLVYKNIEFVEKVFNFLYEINEGFKRLFEWDDPESCLLALISWIIFCFYFRLWTVPLLLLLPFIYYWLYCRYQDHNNNITRTYSNHISETTKNNNKETKGLTGKLQDLQTMTLVITDGIEYIASIAERLYNLVSFKVPFLSYLTMIILLIASLVFYFIPFNYLLMVFGIYKYTRKYLNPDRVLNNDLIDFISRIPDNEVLKDWKELSVPEPVQKHSSGNLARSISTEILS